MARSLPAGRSGTAARRGWIGAARRGLRARAFRLALVAAKEASQETAAALLAARRLLKLRHFRFERLNTAIELFHGRFLDKNGLRHVIGGTRLVAHMLLNPALSVRVARRAVFTGGFESVKKPVNQTLLFRLHDSSLCH